MNNSSQKLVSVIIPAYNIEKYIAQTIESVIRQTYTYLEIIIVNDGSTDMTPAIIQDYAKKDARISIVDQVNKGLAGARNTGFKRATGEYLCIIDADDIMMLEKIESQVRHLENNLQADFTYSRVFYFMDETNEISLRDLAAPDGTISVYTTLLGQGNFISPNAVLFRRSVFEKFGGFDETLRSSEDFDYWLILSQRGVYFLHQEEYLTLCRCRKESLTSDSVTMYSTVVTVFEKHVLRFGNKFLAAVNYPQYFKNLFLLYFSRLKKSKPFFARLFVLLRKAKWKTTFKKIYNKEVQEYLELIESHNHL